MLFNSDVFIFVFLPVTVLGYVLLARWAVCRLAKAWLVGASLFFYGWWNPTNLPLLLFSILFNFAAGIVLDRTVDARWRKLVLIIGMGVNLLLLGYFKYAQFALGTVGTLAGRQLDLETIVLPLAISFFTFQQIAYLVDTYRGLVKERDFLDYCLFVTFFPQLIAGPIVHHKEMLPQFSSKRSYRPLSRNLSIGLTIFSIGLFKKVVIADSMAIYASPLFEMASAGASPTFMEAWVGALSYTLQLYFDFSGYSDMAIGISRMFGITLPLNFDSPYKATSIIDFWRRWHVTLSRFLRDYLYVPLGGSRRGKVRRYVNLLVTMLLGGLWHGAGWTFVFWGFLHGLYLIINHAWRAVRRAMFGDAQQSTWWGTTLATLTTFTAVLVGWVFFRAESFAAASSILVSLSGLNGLDMSCSLPSTHRDLALPLLLGIVWFAPNTQQWMAAYRPVLGSVVGSRSIGRRRRPRWLYWTPASMPAAVSAFLFVASVLNLYKVSEFLYFQF